MRGDQIHDTAEILFQDQPLHGATEILLMNPRDELPALTHLSTQSQFRQSSQNVKNATTVVTQDHGRAQGHFRVRGTSHS